MPAAIRALAVLLVVAAASGTPSHAQDWLGRRQSEGTQGNVEYNGKLTFSRIRYTVGFGGFRQRGSFGELPWAHDYPTADIHLMKIIKELSVTPNRIDGSNVFALDDPEMMNYPIAYMSEPGFWQPSDEEVKGLRTFLLKGGFIVFDDFRDQHLYNLEEQMRRVMPELRFQALDQTHPIFNAFFEIKNFDFGYYGKETYYGMFEDNDPKKRLIAIAGHNQDLGEYWEFSDQGIVPIDLSNEAYKFGVNFYIYGLTH
jgi:hypothetical protein